jgi:hypothetical protein
MLSKNQGLLWSTIAVVVFSLATTFLSFVSTLGFVPLPLLLLGTQSEITLSVCGSSGSENYGSIVEHDN